jgi:hypothetical protein
MYPAGTYSIAPSGLTLVQPSNYTLVYTNGSLVVNRAALTVTADLKFIYRGDPLPALTSTITGFVPGGSNAVISGPTHSVSPSYSTNSPAGVYSIIPANLVLAVPGNYAITYVPGPLYVNPKGQGAKKVDVVLECVDTVSNHPSGFIYLARYSHTNPNNTPVYVPLGADNFITALGSYSGNPPVLFQPGTFRFEIPFDGQRMTWTLRSFNGNQKTSSASDASATSNKCTAHLNRMLSTGTEQSDFELIAYPNPTSGILQVQVTGSNIGTVRLEIYDLTGKLFELPVEMNGNDAQINASLLASGTYILRAITDQEARSFRFVKY